MKLTHDKENHQFILTGYAPYSFAATEEDVTRITEEILPMSEKDLRELASRYLKESWAYRDGKYEGILLTPLACIVILTAQDVASINRLTRSVCPEEKCQNRLTVPQGAHPHFRTMICNQRKDHGGAEHVAYAIHPEGEFAWRWPIKQSEDKELA